MKKLMLIIVLLGVIMLSTLSIYAVSLDDEVTIQINGKLVQLDQTPMIMQSRTLVPLRGVFEKLGIIVDYNQETQQVIAKTNDKEIIMNIGDYKVLVNGKVTTLDVGTILKNNRTFVPIRFIAEAFGYDVDWDGLNRRVIIQSNNYVNSDTLTELPKVGSKEDMFALLNYNETMYNYVLGPQIMLEVGFDRHEESLPTTNEPKTDQLASEDVEYSETNNQVAGVQESDIIKTDGEYIYKVSEDSVLIIDADPDNPKLLNTITDDNQYISGIFLSDNRLVVYGNEYKYNIEPYYSDNEVIKRSMMPHYGGESQTFIKVYDVENVQSPRVLHDYYVDGSYASGRLVDDKLYMVTNKSIWFNWWAFKKDDNYIDSVDETSILPSYTNNVTGEQVYLDFEDISYFPDYVQSTYMITVGLDIGSESEAIDVDAYLGSADKIYVSKDNLYVAIARYEYNILESSKAKLYMPVYDTNTVIYKFGLKNGTIDYSDVGSVEGTILNQFSMDEYNDNFRIATTKNNRWFSPEASTNNVYVLNAQMETIGSLEDLAEGERIYSTRFVGDMIYMVTFKEIDPFFVIDASLPEQPKVLGYLKIPGFSTYMHPIDEHHILGFGHETKTTPEGRVVTDGFKISLFNIEDFENPYEEDKIVIGKNGTYSELEYNHKALMNAINKNTMAFPIRVCDNTDYIVDFVGAYVLDVDVNHINVRGRITHHTGYEVIKEGEETHKYFDWQYNIDRIIYINDELYTFSDAEMQIHDMYSLEKQGELYLQ